MSLFKMESKRFAIVLIALLVGSVSESAFAASPSASPGNESGTKGTGSAGRSLAPVGVSDGVPYSF